ncbi:putative thyroid adenoma-associated protein [Shigella phage ChubbyThor]|nr:putative thyroid adenoma-associated protein [Shigella phage ChubbyThor]
MNWDHLLLAISVFMFFDALLGVYEMSRESKVREMVCCSLIGVAALYFAIGFAVEIFK